jgi:mono/diheme cytochrome c family protein
VPLPRPPRRDPAHPATGRANPARTAAERAAVLLLATALAACENPDPRLFPDPFDPGDGGGTISLERHVQPIFTLHCIACHGGSSPEAQLALESGRLYDPAIGAVGVASWELPSLLRIEPAASDRSYLVRKITGSGIVGDRMPPGGALSPQEIDVIREWIDEGAPNN